MLHTYVDYIYMLDIYIYIYMLNILPIYLLHALKHSVFYTLEITSEQMNTGILVPVL